MTTQERVEVVKTLVAMAEMYGRQLSRGSLALMADALMDLDGAAVLDALRRYVADPASKSFPLPGQVRGMIAPGESDQEIAITVVSRVIEAVSKFGWNNPEKAKEHIGELGWIVVKRDGGWQNLCENLNTESHGTFKAQARELIKALLIQARAGTLNVAHGIPRSSESERLEKTDGPMLLGQFIKPPQEEGKK